MEFFYHARDRSGRIYTGTLEAGTINDAARLLRGRGLYITGLTARKVRHVGHGGKVAMLYIERMLSLVKAQMPLASAAAFVASKEKDPACRESYSRIAEELSHGGNLASAMEHEGYFPKIVCGAVRAGEESGSLGVVLERLHGYLKSEEKLRESLKTAMLYPCLLLGMAVISALFMLLFVLPAFSSLFTSLSVPVPWITRALLSAADMASRWWPLLLLVIVILVVSVKLASRYDRVAVRLGSAMLHMPLAGTFFRHAGCLEMMGTLGILYRSGAMPGESLEAAAGVVRNRYLSRLLSDASSEVTKGRWLSDIMAGHAGDFPAFAIGLVAAGEESGRLDEMFDVVCNECRQRMDTASGRMEAASEPLMVLVLGVVVGAMVLSIVLPLLDAVTSI